MSRREGFERHWLRPMVYVTPMGGGITGRTVYWGSMRRDTGPDPICSICSTGDEGGWHGAPDGTWHGDDCCDYSCWPKVSRATFIYNRTLGRLFNVDRLYWWYAERYGREVLHPDCEADYEPTSDTP